MKLEKICFRPAFMLKAVFIYTDSNEITKAVRNKSCKSFFLIWDYWNLILV